MFIPNTEHQELSLFDSVNQMSDSLRKRLETSWAEVFEYFGWCGIAEELAWLER
jgi:hypothetical protein